MASLGFFGGTQREQKKKIIVPLTDGQEGLQRNKETLIPGQEGLQRNKETLIPIIKKYIMPESII